VTRTCGIPTIGIGAGPDTSGQVLVFQDLLGLIEGRKAKFVPTAYARAGAVIRESLGAWAADVRSSSYPSDEESYH
jgi:3-methyl-2-oxobutanoate hydroxymethyltransferase